MNKDINNDPSKKVMDVVEEVMNGYIFKIPEKSGNKENVFVQMLYAPQYNARYTNHPSLSVMFRSQNDNGEIVKNRFNSAIDKIKEFFISTKIKVIATQIGNNIYAPMNNVSYVEALSEIFSKYNQLLSKQYEVFETKGNVITKIVLKALKGEDYSRLVKKYIDTDASQVPESLPKITEEDVIKKLIESDIDNVKNFMQWGNKSYNILKKNQ